MNEMLGDLFGHDPVAERYPNFPGSKKAEGPSKEAARAIAPLANSLRGKVLRLYREKHPLGLTVDELTHEAKISPFTARPRVSELVAAGFLEDSAERRPNESGHSATVWRASPKAMEAAHD